MGIWIHLRYAGFWLLFIIAVTAISMVDANSLRFISGEDILCPDKQGTCPDSSTCCILPSGTYGCCPMLKAVCCADKEHCCPSDHTCDLVHGRCVPDAEPATRLLSSSIAKTKLIAADFICPGGQSSCGDGQTCCLITSGSYGCCPLPRAVCCSDLEHCCPQGYTCDVSAGTCDQSSSNGVVSIPWISKFPSSSTAVMDVVCPGGQSFCADGQTCCELSSGDYGCCPIPQAVCCSDMLHCCPQGTTCDVAEGKCLRSDSASIPWVLKVSTSNSRRTRNQFSDHGSVILIESKVPDLKGNNIVCPDGKSACFDGQTCCITASGSYACCPLSEAVCCSDLLHCCPKGTTCNVAQGKCDQSTSSTADSIPWVLRKPESSRIVGDVVCPGGQSSCQDGETCCKLASGDYGCCPLPQAVCCSDMEHCCPQGTTCDVAQGKCDQSTSPAAFSVPWVLKKPASSRIVGDVVCPGGQSSCQDGETCCKLASGDYGCCPLPQAVCCSDMEHCCPQGTTCDVAQGKCDQSTSPAAFSVPWVLKKPASSRIVGDVVCPGGQSSCQDGETCCKLASGDYGCCPLPQAVCCSDMEHCCPQGTTCDVAQGKCDQSSSKGTVRVPWVYNKPASSRIVGDVICPGGESSCQDGETCCKLASGEYGCCPLPQAVCCSDMEHCCPQGTTCDVAQGKCDQSSSKGTVSVPWVLKKPASSRIVGDVVCPGGQSSCQDGETCCKLASGDYGCCPLPQAVCCSDMEHCCPQGTTCDVAQGKCDQSSSNTAVINQVVLKKSASSRIVADVVCPGGQSSCQDGETCCKLASGDYGCCPLPQAVCCSDMEHCCPQGTTCDVAQGKCDQSTSPAAFSVPWVLKKPASSRIVRDVVCPGGQSSCQDGETCCKLASGDYGCCPLPQAVCCSDMEHCCPQGTTCDVAQGKCDQSSSNTAVINQVVLKKSASSRIVADVVCPGGQSSCQDGETCCKLASGDYGCCPLPQAVCCSDMEHCCPQGTTCDVAQGKCDQSSSPAAFSVPWVLKKPASSRIVGDVVCPGGQSSCQDGETCCKLASGDYGCCPLPQAVCCSDMEHCCPQGTTCDVAQGKCDQSTSPASFSVPWVLKKPASSRIVGDVVCPGGQSSCQDGETCCKLASGDYGCCPLPQAVCCSDMEHCCPQGTTCNVAQGKCDQSSSNTAVITQVVLKKPASSRIVGDVICPGGQSSCQDGETCCKLASGDYGCCPLPQAVCCSDMEHCCPQGTICDVAQGKCDQSSNAVVSIPWVLKKPASSRIVGDVVCPGGQSSCQDGETCCKLASGAYGCCPLPQSTICNVAQGKCDHSQSDAAVSIPCVLKDPASSSILGNVLSWWSVNLPRWRDLLYTGNRQLKLLARQLQMAVCCSDLEHCCPQGTTCDVAQGKCDQSISNTSVSIPWVLKKPVTRTGQKQVLSSHSSSTCSTLVGGQQAWCNDEGTCCQAANGNTGCCPFKGASCCSDGIHCCPAGTQCNAVTLSCQSVDSSLSFTWSRTERVAGYGLFRAVAVQRVPCLDNSTCPDGTTCCPLQFTKQYSCCIYAQAVCCSDLLHCCPSSMTCDVEHSRCVQTETNTYISWSMHVRSHAKFSPLPDKATSLASASATSANQMCADLTSECPDDATCCLLQSGAYGCCPHKNAVCCSDKLHCCPTSYTCNVEQQSCQPSVDTAMSSDNNAIPFPFLDARRRHL